ncbi:zinc-finger of monoamine-oxidase A repressor R1 [Senna tora]|uniref:Zinc-finger of monoamine-oxidase A repressor R1 n=1 Tax=Senna tora TaxID=362788 RepID=A0A834TMA7_9FABA|nr:zinc-finger of monoamine-oxidase A repressor R1 [Senna tora]
MEVSVQQCKESSPAKKRAKCPGIRVIHGRIYDSENGVCCHQCRQKTRDFAASCKNLMGHKLCVIKFCHKCLLNRYGEKAEEVDVLTDWKCPRCRGICNCSHCMKRRGQKPTGPLVHTAKASGFSSVSEMLEKNISYAVVSPRKAATSEKDQMIGVDYSVSDEVAKSDAVPPKMPVTTDKELVVALPGKHGKENSLDGNCGLKVDPQKALPDPKEKPKKTKRAGLKEICNGSRVEDACQNRSPKRVKTSHEVPSEETEGNANDGNKICNGVSERETNINRNHDITQKEKKVSRKRASKNVSLNPNKEDAKEEMSERNCQVTLNIENKEINNIISLPPGSILTDIADIEFGPEDVGHALQFLEFCTAFEKVLDMKEGEAEAILQELTQKQNARRSQKTLLVQFHIRLLTLILSDSGDEPPSLKSTSGKNSWLSALRNLISESDFVPKELQLDSLEEGPDGYYNLDLSEKLRLLNFLCDEALGTENIRSYIDEQNSRFVESAKEAKVKVAAAKEKKRSLKQKLTDDLAKAIIAKNGAPLSISEHGSLVSKIKSEADRAHAEMLEAMGMVPKKKQRSDVVRTEPVFLDGSGRAFWKLKCYAAEYAVLMQDIKIQDAAAADERWFVYGAELPEHKHEIEMYISSSRSKRTRVHGVSCTVPNESSKANI